MIWCPKKVSSCEEGEQTLYSDPKKGYITLHHRTTSYMDMHLHTYYTYIINACTCMDMHVNGLRPHINWPVAI